MVLLMVALYIQDWFISFSCFLILVGYQRRGTNVILWLMQMTIRAFLCHIQAGSIITQTYSEVYHTGHIRIVFCLILGLLWNLVLSCSLINSILIWKWPKWNDWYDWASTDIFIQQMKEAHLPLPGAPIPFLFQHMGQR